MNNNENMPNMRETMRIPLELSFEKQFIMEDLSTDLPKKNHEKPFVDKLFHLFLSSYLLFTHLHLSISSAR